MRQRSNRRWNRVVLLGAMVAAVELSAGYAVSADRQAAQPQIKPAAPSKRGNAGQSTVKLPIFPQKFDVQGPESDSYGFAVTQAGPIVVDVTAQGAPIVVTLQSPGGQPVTQQGSGNVRVSYNATPQDVQRSLFWTVLVRAWCEDDCRVANKRPRATGSVTVQHPPVNDAAVQQAIQTMTAQPKQPSPQEKQQAGAQAAAQMEQAFQQRKAQFEQQQLQRRANLYARIQPQLNLLRSRAGGQVRARGLDDTATTTTEEGLSLPPPNVIWLTEGAQAEDQQDGGEIGTRALPEIRRPMTPGVQALSAAAVQPGAQPPTFPQKFQVQGAEISSFAFGVTQPGPIEVAVDSQGPPVIVTLQHLASSPISQQGTAQIRLSHAVSAEEIQKSALWLVKIRLVQPGAPASGTVIVQHPPADSAAVQAQAAALAQQEAAQQPRTTAEVEAQSRAEFQAFKANFEQQQTQRLMVERAQNQPLIDRLRAKSGAMIRSRGLNPSITRVNKNEGQPKTQLIIEGTGFGPGGEVVFQLGPNVTGTGIVEAWADTLVVANVPDASGLLPYQGTITIRVGQMLSNAVPFKFTPVQEPREIRSTQGDISIAQPGTVIAGSIVDRVEHPNTSFGGLAGNKGNDIFFPTRQLSNGWVVHEIKLKVDPCSYPDCRGAYVADSRVGTPLPFFNVRWWHEVFVGSRYSFTLWIVGPRGVPDGILNTGLLTPVVPPGTPPPPTTASSTPPAERTPPAQPPYNPPPSSTGAQSETKIVPLNPGTNKAAAAPTQSQPAPQEQPQMTVVPINPALLIPQVQAAPGSGTSSGTATANQPPNVTTTSPPFTRQPPANPPSQAASTTPILTSLGVTQGQPGDPVMINGSNFGGGVGEVHFVIANGKDEKAPAATVWTDGQIFTSVPDVAGVVGFSGTVYVKRMADLKMSNLVPFRFEPTMEIREIRATMDRILKPPSSSANPADTIYHVNDNFILGFKDNDEFMRNTRLKNGWVSESALVTCWQTPARPCGGGAYVWEIKQGTDWPYLNARWWVNPAPFANISVLEYRFAVRIVGPKGVPDGVVMP
jgi:hypothetical protein